MLNLVLGTPLVRDGRDWISTRGELQGHALYGPYQQVSPGHYRVEFMIEAEVDGVWDPDQTCAVIDVVSDSGQRDLAFDYVTIGQLNGKPIALDFVVPENRILEYRVYISGLCPLIIADNPQITVIDRAEQSFSRAERIAKLAPESRAAIKKLFLKGVRLDFRNEDVIVPSAQFPALMTNLLGAAGDRHILARQVAEAVGFRGDHENSLYRAFVGTERPLTTPPSPVPFTSTVCQQAHFGLDQYRFWAWALKEPPRFSRKQWEFVYIAQSLFERGYLQGGRKGLAFGAGEEQLPALFASWGVKILATDQASETAIQGGWAETGQHTRDLRALNKSGICTDKMFSELVSFQPVDMNDIPASLDGQFDFCWSACALEHLGSLEHGMRFIEQSMKTLCSGGLAIHTTEFNLNSDDDTVESPHLSIYRRRDIDGLATRLKMAGYEVAPVDWTLGEGFAETVVDLPPFGRGEPHLRLRSGQYDTTSIGLIVRKP